MVTFLDLTWAFDSVSEFVQYVSYTNAQQISKIRNSRNADDTTFVLSRAALNSWYVVTVSILLINSVLYF